MRRYLALVFVLDDPAIESFVNTLLTKNGGRVSVAVLEIEYRKRYKHWYAQIFDEDTWRKERLSRIYVPYRIDQTGIVTMDES